MEHNPFTQFTIGTSHETDTIYSSEKRGTSENISQGYGINFQKYHGLGLKYHLYNQQLKHLHTLIGETTNKIPTGILFQASAEQLRLEIRLLGIFKDIS